VKATFYKRYSSSQKYVPIEAIDIISSVKIGSKHIAKTDSPLITQRAVAG
jgi:hypothetical protein